MFNKSHTASRCFYDSDRVSVLRGRCLRSLRFVFSFVPRCHGAFGSQNQTSAPNPFFNSRQDANSVPRSKVNDLRAFWGREANLSTTWCIMGLDWRSLFRNNAVYLALRSTNVVMFALPYSLRNMTRSPSQWPNWFLSLTSFGRCLIANVGRMLNTRWAPYMPWSRAPSVFGQKPKQFRLTIVFAVNATIDCFVADAQ